MLCCRGSGKRERTGPASTYRASPTDSGGIEVVATTHSGCCAARMCKIHGPDDDHGEAQNPGRVAGPLGYGIPDYGERRPAIVAEARQQQVSALQPRHDKARETTREGTLQVADDGRRGIGGGGGSGPVGDLLGCTLRHRCGCPDSALRL